MLNKKELLEVADEQYRPMLKEVSIPDFTKCIAQFSGLHISEVNNNVIKEYLLTWARNKFRFYKMLGNKLKVDYKIQYKEENKDAKAEMEQLEKNFISWALWIDSFKYTEKNKITMRDVNYDTRDIIKNIFPANNFEGCSLTHFFKSYLNAPDELVTAIGKIWENNIVEGNYTVSIDPVDMMLASENPYGWTSCYRLEEYNGNSHADGCLAAILDDSSLITYIWNREGKFMLYDEYDFKSIRYYRMREWISISPSNSSIHFNAIYPGKEYPAEFEKQLRLIVEKLVNENAIWKMNDNYFNNCCERGYVYGYDEFGGLGIYKIKDSEDEMWQVYNTEILCPCGCGMYLPGNDWDNYEGYEYNGEGFIAENFCEKDNGKWCDLIEDYCEDWEDCSGCPYWNRDHASCELNEDEYCENYDKAEDNDCFNPYDNNIVHCGSHCEGCPLYKLHHQEEKN